MYYPAPPSEHLGYIVKQWLIQTGHSTRIVLALPPKLVNTMITTLKDEWFGNIRADLLAGLVVALALIPEAIAFSIIAGVDPRVGLYASFCIAVVIAFVGVVLA